MSPLAGLRGNRAPLSTALALGCPLQPPRIPLPSQLNDCQVPSGLLGPKSPLLSPERGPWAAWGRPRTSAGPRRPRSAAPGRARAQRGVLSVADAPDRGLHAGGSPSCPGHTGRCRARGGRRALPARGWGAQVRLISASSLLGPGRRGCSRAPPAGTDVGALFSRNAKISLGHQTVHKTHLKAQVCPFVPRLVPKRA